VGGRVAKRMCHQARGHGDGFVFVRAVSLRLTREATVAGRSIVVVFFIVEVVWFNVVLGEELLVFRDFSSLTTHFRGCHQLLTTICYHENSGGIRISLGN
jgi:hypothetical protein